MTSWAVGVTTSAWLVPPYLVAMAWLLMTPSPKLKDVGAGDSQTPTDQLPNEASNIEEPAPAPPLETSEPTKPKSTRSRGRKPKAKVATSEPAIPVIATW